MKVILLTTANDINDPRPKRVFDALNERSYECIFLGNFSNSEIFSKPDARIISAYSETSGEVKSRSFFQKLFNIIRVLLVEQFGLTTTMFTRSQIKRTLLGEEYLVKFEAMNLHDSIVILFDWRLLILVDAIKRNGARKIIYYVREFYSGQGDYSIIWRLRQKKLISNIEKLYLSKVSKVVTISPGISQLYESMYQLEDRIDTDFCVPKLDRVNESGIESLENLLFIGNVSKDRGIGIALNALKLLPQSFNLTLLGNLRRSYSAELGLQLKIKGLESRVHFLSPVEYGQIPFIAKSFSFGLIPNLVDLPQKKFALPNKFFEYLYSGLPVICVEGSYIADLVTNNEIGITFDGTAQDLRNRILNVTLDEYFLMKRNLDMYLGENSYEVTIDNLIALLL